MSSPDEQALTESPLRSVGVKDANVFNDADEMMFAIPRKSKMETKPSQSTQTIKKHETAEENDLPALSSATEPLHNTAVDNADETTSLCLNDKGLEEGPSYKNKAKSKASKAVAKPKTAKNVHKKQKANAKATKPADRATSTKGGKKTVAKGTNKKGGARNTAKSNKIVTAKGKAARGKAKQEVESEDKADSATSAGLDLFTKHYREFERALARLEKVDQFGYFWDAAPEELVEYYSNGTEDDANADTETSAEAEVGEADKNSTTLPDKTEFPSHPPFNWEMVRRRRDQGRYILDIRKEEEDRIRTIGNYINNSKSKAVSVLHPKGVNWPLFAREVMGMCKLRVARNPNALGDGKAGSLDYAVKKIKGAMAQYYERTGRRHINEVSLANDRHQYAIAMEAAKNTEAAFQGKWRQTPFPERKYERLSDNKVCAGLSELDERIATYELRTSLPDSFVGLSYKYEDNTGKSEAWMKSILSGTGGKKKQEAAKALAEDDGVIRAQVATTMESLLIGVQDRVMTEAGVLQQRELRSANWEADPGDSDIEVKEVASESTMPEVVEQPVWGIDCYTRRNITECLAAKFDQETALVFIEKWLLPAINACPVDLAHDISNAALILEGLPFNTITMDIKNLEENDQLEDSGGEEGPTELCKREERWSHSLLGKALMSKIKTSSPPWLKLAAQELRRARKALGPDFFRVHPKGHGSVVLSPKLPPNTLVTFYRGEVYPSWRWGEKMDAIDITQARKKLKPNLPDFYNMMLERPQKDPRKYGLLFVDASRKAGHGSSLSHSCAPTCEVRVAAKDGELCLAMTTLRSIEMGEELTFDYNAVTESLVEYRSAVCLCGYKKCRGSFLHFATADCYQQVLNRNAPIAVRFASLAKGCMKEVVSREDQRTLRNHGFMTAAFGAISVNRHKASGFHTKDATLDSMDIVPVWLQTYVADTLRYIEYERRALPIALICDHLAKPESDTLKSSELVTSKNDGADDNPASGKKRKATPTEVPCDDGNDKDAKVSKPMPTFFFYSRANKQRFHSLLKQEGTVPKDVSGLHLEQEIKKIASEHWKLLSKEEKSKWKKKAEKDWAKKGGREKNEKSTKKARQPKKDESLESKLESSNISFQAADTEGASAMEQRIQQLTQSLSRVGRVLDRHREASLKDSDKEDNSSEALRNRVHSPLAVATDEQVVSWMWNDEDGVVRQLLSKADDEECVSPSLRAEFTEILSKYDALDKFGAPSRQADPSSLPITPQKARKKLVRALLELRKAILKDLKNMAKDLKREKAREKAERKKLREQEQEKPSEAGAEGPNLEDADSAAMVVQKLPILAEDEKVEKVQTGTHIAAQYEEHAKNLVDNSVKGEITDVAGGCATRQEMEPERNNNFNQEGILVMDIAECGESSVGTPGLLSEGTSAQTFGESPSSPVFDDEDDAMSVVASVVRGLIDAVVTRVEFAGCGEDSAEVGKENITEIEVSKCTKEKTESGAPLPWLQQYGQRFKLQAAADLLLMYAKTSTFFLMKPYKPLKSTPIEVYARELGNAVPRSVIDKSVKKGLISSCNNSNQCHATPVDSPVQPDKSQEFPSKDSKKVKKKKVLSDTIPETEEELCEPDDIVAEVTVKYHGDYTLAQLLQWYNGGIGQNPGLPDLLGCVRLPPMAGCWEVKSGKIAKNKVEKPTRYETEVRPKLIEWMNDPHQRGSPWPDEIRHAFTSRGADLPTDTSAMFLPLGSPILDLLVTGDDLSILSVLEEFGAHDAKEAAADGLLSTMDQGRPAQAVSNWVQCENPTCGRWRKIPWYVDIDVLAEKFVCSDNKWNISSASCDAPEDDYEEHENEVVLVKGPNGDLIEVPSPRRKAKPPSPTKKLSKEEKLKGGATKKESKRKDSVKKKEPERKDAATKNEPKQKDAHVTNEGIPAGASPLTKDKRKERETEVQKALQAEAFSQVPVDEEFFVPDARMDVRREGKSSFQIGKVVTVKVDENGKKLALFHFPRQRDKYDEWIEIDSPRIAPLWTKVQAPPTKRKKSATKDKAGDKANKKTTSKGEKKAKSFKKESSLHRETQVFLPSLDGAVENSADQALSSEPTDTTQATKKVSEASQDESSRPGMAHKLGQARGAQQLSSAEEDAVLLLQSLSRQPAAYMESSAINNLEDTNPSSENPLCPKYASDEALTPAPPKSVIEKKKVAKRKESSSDLVARYTQMEKGRIPKKARPTEQPTSNRFIYGGPVRHVTEPSEFPLEAVTSEHSQTIHEAHSTNGGARGQWDRHHQHQHYYEPRHQPSQAERYGARAPTSAPTDAAFFNSPSIDMAGNQHFSYGVHQEARSQRMPQPFYTVHQFQQMQQQVERMRMQHQSTTMQQKVQAAINTELQYQRAQGYQPQTVPQNAYSSLADNPQRMPGTVTPNLSQRNNNGRQIPDEYYQYFKS